MLMSMASIIVCLRMQRKAKSGPDGWDGDFNTLSQPHKSIIWFLSYMQTFPTVTLWLVCGVVGTRRYLDMVPLPSTGPSLSSKSSPALYIGESLCINSFVLNISD
jgi:hypothetical protein